MQHNPTNNPQALQTNLSPVQLTLPGIEFAPRQVREHGLAEAHTWPLVSDGKVQGVVQASFRVHASVAWSFPSLELRSAKAWPVVCLDCGGRGGYSGLFAGGATARDPESGKAAGLNRSKLKLSKWAEEYERVQGKIRCPQRERNNARRGQGKRVQDRVSRPTGRHRREEMNPQQQERQAKIPAGRDGWGGPDRERVAWQRAEERWEWEQLQRRRGKALGELEKRSKREWSALYGRHQQQREYLAKDCRGALGRFRLWRELGGKVREIGGAIRGDKEVLGRFRAELEDRLRWDRVSLGKEHSEAVRGIESKAGEFYREGLEGSEKRAREAARTDGISVRYGWRRDQFDTFKYSMLEERLEQVREIDGELAYEKMRRAVEKASQEKASQEKARQARQVERAREVERARRERDMQETARQSRGRRGPERGGPERDFGPSR